MHPPPSRATLAWACVVSFALLSLGNAAAVALFVDLPGSGLATRLWHHALDFGHHLALGLAVAAAVWLGHRALGLRGAVAAWGLLALGLGAFTMREDMPGLIERLTEASDLSPELVQTALIAAVSSLAPLCALLGHALDGRFRWALAPVLAAGLMALNNGASDHQNRGVHLSLELATAALLAPAIARGLSRFPPPRRPLVWNLAALAACAGFAVWTFLRPLKNEVAIDMSRWDGAVAAPFLSADFERANDVGRMIDLGGPFFQTRRRLPPIPPSEPSLLGDNGIVIVLTLDSVRADVVLDPKYRDWVPQMTRMRQEGFTFTQARAPGTQTTYTLTEMSKSTYFSQQRWSRITRRTKGRGTHAPVHDRAPHLAQLLAKAGAHTFAALPAPWIEGRRLMTGFAEGGYQVADKGWTHCSILTGRLIDAVAHRPDRSLFAFVHYLDTHGPYTRGGTEGTAFERYLAEVRLVDEQIGRLMQALRDAGLERRTLLFVSADHGEAFGEHNTTSHATTLYEELLRVPLIAWGAGVKGSSDTPVSLIDIAPTTLDLLGAATPAHMMGQSLVPLLRGERIRLERPIVAEGRLLQSMVFDDGIKVIRDLRRNTVEVYDLNRDPGELKNLSDKLDLATDDHIGLLAHFFDVHTYRKGGYEVPFVR